jgi:hypothetical protein
MHQTPYLTITSFFLFLSDTVGVLAKLIHPTLAFGVNCLSESGFSGFAGFSGLKPLKCFDVILKILQIR